MMHENGSLIGDVQEEIKGIIPFPCCPKEKKVVISGSGLVTDKCPCCGKFALFNMDLMNSQRIKPIRGAVSRARQMSFS